MPELRGLFKPGDKVCCCYRLPTVHQWWVAPKVWVATVLEPGNDPAAWNGHNSERDYCERTKKMKLLYSFGIMHDAEDALFPAPRDADFEVKSEAEADWIVGLAHQQAARYADESFPP
jgi:hypothetical protein